MAKKWYPGTLRQRGASWRWELMINGERHSQTFNGCTFAEAAQAARDEHDRLLAAHDRQRAGLLGRVRMTKLISQYRDEVVTSPPLAESTVRTYKHGLARFEAFFEEQDDPFIDEVRAGHIRRYITWRRSHGDRRRKDGSDTQLAARTLAKDRTMLHTLFEYAFELEVIDRNTVARTKQIKWDPRQPVILSVDEYELLLTECEHDRTLWLYALSLGEMGGRCDSEVLWLQWPDVDLADGFLQIHGRNRRTKGGRGRYVPMTPRLHAAMRQHFADFRFKTYPTPAGEMRSPWVFHHVKKRRHAQAGDRIGRMRGAFNKARERAGLSPDLHQHDLRHRRVTSWLAEGRDVTLVKEAIGHADLRTTMGYTHLAKEHLRALVEDRPPLEKSQNSH